MTKFEDAERVFIGMPVEEIQKVKDHIKVWIREAKMKEKGSLIDEFQQNAHRGAFVKFTKTTTSGIGIISAVTENGVQLVLKGKKNRVLVRWVDIDKVSDTEDGLKETPTKINATKKPRATPETSVSAPMGETA